MNWTTLGAYALGVASIVGGALLTPINPMAGAAVISAGSWWIGKLQSQPAFTAPKPTLGKPIK